MRVGNQSQTLGEAPSGTGGAPVLPKPQRAFILVGVLVLVMLVSMIAVSLMFRVRADETATAASSSGDQAFAAAMAGVQEAMRVAREAKPGFTDWEDAPQIFRDRLVYDDGSDKWYFTVWSASSPESLQQFRYGLTDEASKVNVNAVRGHDLAKLQNVTPLVAAALRDFIDFDDLTSPDGAEQDYYNGLPQPYTIRNGPIPTIDGLLLVRGITAEILYGEDSNMNFRLDPTEEEGSDAAGLGLRRSITVFSFDPNKDRDGVPRTDLNNASDPFPGVEFPEAMTNFISEVRRNKLALGQAADLLEGAIKIKDGLGREQTIVSGVGKAELPLAMDLFTTSREPKQDGLININTASIEVLTTVPGIDEPLAEAILSTRKSISQEKRDTIAWLFQENVVDAAAFKRLAPYLTARGFQFSFQVIGFGAPSGRFRRMEVVIDSSESTPRVVYLRDLTRLGLPFRLESQSTEAPAQARASRKPEKKQRG